MSARWTQGLRNGLEVVEIDAPAARAVVALQGAQVVSFTPRGDHDWLWVSERARWAPSTALRGGIPLCFPWFGPHPTEPTFPAHGFARTRPWRLDDARQVGDGVSLTLALASDDETRKLFPHAFEARLTLSVGAELALALDVRNPGTSPFAFEVAFHSYFAVSDVSAVSVEGLAGSEYVDKVAGGARQKEGAAPLRIAGEVDCVYDHAGPVTLVDPVLGQHGRLTLRGSNAGSTVVWNPAPAKTARLSDVAPDGYRRFVCVETGAIGERRVTVPAGGERRVGVTITRP